MDLSPDSQEIEAALKKKLQVFLQELMRIGTVKGFKHFSCYVRGREELVLAVNNTLRGSSYSRNISAPPSRKQSMSVSDSFHSSHLPYDKRSLLLSHNTQLGLSGFRERGVGLPPASPSEQEHTPDEDSTLFLVAGYARYLCPYVWVRSNHDRLFQLSGDTDNDKDSPLRLKSTSRWKDGDVHVVDIIAEVVKLCTYPAPRNPYEVDLDYFHSLSQPDQLLSSAAMVAYLRKIVVSWPESKSYAAKVFEDLYHLTKLHFGYLRDLTESSSIPILQQEQQQNNQHKRQQQQQQHRTSSRQSQRAAHMPETSFPPFGQPPPMSVQPTQPVNASGVRYGQGPKGAYPGGFERKPTPSMF